MIVDRSGNDRDGFSVGIVEYIPFNRCTYGALCDDMNYIQLPGTATSSLSGFYKDRHPGGAWRYFRNSAEIPTISRDGNDYVLKDGAYANLVMSDVSGQSQSLSGFDEGFSEGFA